MPHKFDPRNMSKLDERTAILPPEGVLKSLGLLPGSVMVDIGAGAGHFTIAASSIVGPTGRVIAIDSSEEMIRELESRISKAGARNVEIIHSSEYDLMAEKAIADFSLLCTVLHEVEDKVRFLQAVVKILKSGGKLAVVEWAKKDMEPGPPLFDRIGMPEAVDMLKRTGLTDTASSDFNDYFYFATAIKP